MKKLIFIVLLFFTPLIPLVLESFSGRVWRGAGVCFAQNTLTFSYTGAVQTFTVPGCVDTIHVKAWGAGGSGGGADSYGGAVGGAGGYIISDIPVTAGQVLSVIVGGGAGPGVGCVACSGGGPAGWGGGLVGGGSGGNAGCSPCSGGGGGGGGGSAIYNGATALIVAGGGGGGSGGGQFSSGGAGGAAGQNGNGSSNCSTPGLVGGSSTGNGNNGIAKGGGDGAGGGAGGGGYNGGSGGSPPPGCDCGGCGGGGGASYSSGTNTTITYGSGQTAGNNTDPVLPPGAAVGGGTSTSGGNGFIQLIFNGAPYVAFGGTKVCNGDPTQFTDSTVNSSGVIVNRIWDFGDGTPVNTTQNPSHTYANPGTYTVTLFENNSVGCSDTLSKTIQVYYNPTAGFTHTDVCLRDSMYFINTTTIDPSTSIATYLWSFGDGSATSNLKNPAHYYATSGTYTVTLVTTSIDGCSDVAIVPVKTFDPPTTAFSVSNTCLANPAVFLNTTLPPTMGTTANWSWNFGDGAPLNTTDHDPQHLYSTPGNYQVTLVTHSSNLGCPDTLQDSVTVHPMPVSDFSSADVCLHNPMNFVDSSQVPSGTITSIAWDFGDGTLFSTIPNASHIYTNPGSYNVSFIITSNNGCKDTSTQNVVVHPLPVAQFSAVNVCDGTNVQFHDHSTIAPPDIMQVWGWSYGDGGVATIPSPSHLYAAPGTYTIQLLTVSSFGCHDSISKAIVVNPNPNVNFNGTNLVGCEPLCVNFVDSSSILSGGNNAQWNWNVGDGSPPNSSTIFDHCYVNDSLYLANSYAITLTVTSDSGCATTKVKNNYVTVYPNPKANFGVQPTVTPITDPVIAYADLCSGTTIWNWNFGDSATTTLQQPTPHTYKDTGTFVITLIASTQYNCRDTAYKTVTIEPDFFFFIPNSFTPDGDGLNDTFTGKGIFIKEFKMTIFDRWGNAVYTTTDIHQPWDGRANHGAELAQRDVYVYHIHIVEYRNEREHDYKGTVTLVR